MNNRNLSPLQVDGIKAVKIGTMVWGISFMLLALSRNFLEETGRAHWIWIAASGVALGLLGYRYTTNRVKRLGLVREDFIFRKFNKREPDQSRLIQDFE